MNYFANKGFKFCVFKLALFPKWLFRPVLCVQNCLFLELLPWDQMNVLFAKRYTLRVCGSNTDWLNTINLVQLTFTSLWRAHNWLSTSPDHFPLSAFSFGQSSSRKSNDDFVHLITNFGTFSGQSGLYFDLRWWQSFSNVSEGYERKKFQKKTYLVQCKARLFANFTMFY